MTTAPRERKSDRTRARILDAAVETFRTEGLGDTRLSDIADKAGLQTASLYYYFDSKEALIEAVVGSDLDAIYEHVKERVREVPAEAHAERIRTAIAAHAEQAFLPGSAATVRMYGQLPPTVQQRFTDRYETVTRYWTTLLKKAQMAGVLRPELSPRLTALLILGALNWATEWHGPEHKDVEDLVAEISLLLDLS